MNQRGGGKEQTESIQEHYIIPDLIRAFLSPTTTTTPPPLTLLLSLALPHILYACLLLGVIGIIWLSVSC